MSIIIEVARGGQVERQLEADPPPAVASGHVAVVTLPSDADGHPEAPDAGQVVLSVPSPETLAREPDEVRRVIEQAGTGVEPLVVLVEAAEQIRADELAAVVEAADRSERSVILRIMGDA
jgi:hypothetical protein